MGAHVFDQAIALTATGDGQYTGATSPAYANMVGPFGGVTAATALNAVMQHPALLGEPLSLTVNFCAAAGRRAVCCHRAAGAHQPLDPALGHVGHAGWCVG